MVENNRVKKVIGIGTDTHYRHEWKHVINMADLAAIRGLLPAGMLMDGRIVSWSESDELRTLNCAVEVLPLDGEARYQWRDHRLTAVTEEIWN